MFLPRKLKTKKIHICSMKQFIRSIATPMDACNGSSIQATPPLLNIFARHNILTIICQYPFYNTPVWREVL